MKTEEYNKVQLSKAVGFNNQSAITKLIKDEVLPDKPKYSHQDMLDLKQFLANKAETKKAAPKKAAKKAPVKKAAAKKRTYNRKGPENKKSNTHAILMMTNFNGSFDVQIVGDKDAFSELLAQAAVMNSNVRAAIKDCINLLMK